MKEKPNEWVAISDLMAGVVAVVMLLLVMAVLKNAAAEMAHREQAEKGSIAQRKKIATMLGQLQADMASQGASQLVRFDIDNGKMTWSDSVFARSSACITPQARELFGKTEAVIADFLANNQGAQVFVEGHTDNLAVSKPVTDIERYCTVYDDNYTLSAARAREARRLLVGRLSAGSAKNVVVAGYGDSHPLDAVDPGNPRNRRVEVRLVPAEP
ncbi:OmpA family protein [Janthinobacterium sp. FW305-129]|uniref:OmpA/MotB family protein n=1 Tax=Janthinobacterium sp. FW305-129 TaxID=2775054 RepID=UPI001E3A928F|nr:OmpA family protein [Janthinobacterium sp. FW305-129]MCC7598145.1 OmpA family protein [Janthinobacterium sp. FW305-129]